MKVSKTFIAAALVSTSAFAGNVPAGPMVAPSGSVVTPVSIGTAARDDAPVTGDDAYVASEAGIKNDCLVVDGAVLSCFGVPAEMARINRLAKELAKHNPQPTPCLAHVQAVRELAPQYTVYQVTSSMGGWENHASALVVAGNRYFLLDNGALREHGVWGQEGSTPYDWAEVTGIDMSGWHLQQLAAAR